MILLKRHGNHEAGLPINSKEKRNRYDGIKHSILSAGSLPGAGIRDITAAARD